MSEYLPMIGSSDNNKVNLIRNSEIFIKIMLDKNYENSIDNRFLMGNLFQVNSKS